MKKIIFSFVVAFVFSATIVDAQYEYYPALFGRQTFYGGTARYLAIGGAGTSLGGDLGSASVNPAGLGMYRKSEFSFSPNIGFSGSNTDYLGVSQHSSNGSFSISNMGVAICGIKDDLDKSDWRGGTFSLSMNRTNNFRNRVSFYGVDPQSSIAQYFVQQANGTSVADLDAQNPTDGINSLAALGYWTYLIDPTTIDGDQYTNYLSNEKFTKEGTYTTSGAQYQWNIAYGANYKDKLYIGGGLGITSINFKEDLNYNETTDYTVDGFKSLSFNDYNRIRGTGVNFKMGYIYKVSDALKLGTTVTTPTFTALNQEYSSDLSVSYPFTTPSGSKVSEITTPGIFKFNYVTPAKIASGLSLFAGKAGFASFDIEYIPYQFSRMSGKTSYEDRYLSPYNTIVNNTYKNVLNLRAGAEIRLDMIRLRGGLAYLPNPYKYNDGVNRNVAQLSGGIGVKLEDVYFDFGLINTRYQSSYSPYQLDGSATPTAVSKNSFVNAVITMGFYFE